RIGASRRTSASGQSRPVNSGVPKGCSEISAQVSEDGSDMSPRTSTKANPCGWAIRARRIPAILGGPQVPQRPRPTVAELGDLCEVQLGAGEGVDQRVVCAVLRQPVP